MLRRVGLLTTTVAIIGFASVAIVSLASPSAHSSTTLRPDILPSSSTSTTVPAANITMSFVGDTDLGNTPVLPPNPWGYLTPVRSALTAEIQFMNLEGTLTSAASSKCSAHSTNCYAFRNPPAYAQILKSYGFTVVNSANNHSHDFGSQGASDTSLALAHAGIVQAGLPGQIGYRHVGKITVAFVDFAPYSNTNNMLNFSQAALLIHRAKQHASFVVVYMHAGAEGQIADHVTGHEEYYVGEDRGNPEAFAHAAINDGASLVIASGPHSLRGMQFYRGHLIAYSLGDFANYQNFANVGTLAYSGILKVTLSATGTYVTAKFVPVLLLGAGRAYVDPHRAASLFVARLSKQDFGLSAPGIAANGNLVPPAHAFH